MQEGDDEAGGLSYLGDFEAQTQLAARAPTGTLIQGQVTPHPPVTPGVRGPVPGQVIAGRYRVERWLGAGGTSTVHAATDLRSGAQVALKLLMASVDDTEMVTRFRKEVDHVRVLEHPNIARVLDVGLDGQRHFLVVELLEGMDLKRLIASRRPSLAESLRWLTHATCALEHAHAHGVLHRDVKSPNLFITPTGILKLMDFGLAKSAHVDSSTTQGTVMGTPEYMAPEQVMGAPPASAATDLYSLGVVAYELVTGQLPFRHPQPVPLMFLQVQQLPAPPRTLCPHLPVPFERVILTLMAKQPQARFPSASALRVALRDLWPLVLSTAAQHPSV
ncbi:serine/threonine-protein kinase [Stigmatella sp. ncwal1]|uniref:Serine/threonine-protein kinase n=1 Tax=Stigmatella ashevillensis TaxID=2995309 RepID=A0ABT5DBX1_9BACT|nr:serine/threonine-protein kinase [Stigmatella ashevillena]MDC0711109.1 serine/threonine-protein kinase [Stigmatella ashevillena]